MVESWTMAGHETIVYWGGDKTDEKVEFVSLLSETEQFDFFGEYSGDLLPQIGWSLDLPYWKLFNERSIIELRKRFRPGDFIALCNGYIHAPVVEEFQHGNTIIEPGVGYEGIMPSGTFCAFESYAWMHHRYGAYGINDGRAYDAVVPHPLRQSDFHVGHSGGYLAFMGRFIARKGPSVPADVGRRLGLRVRMAGGGVKLRSEGLLVATDGTEVLGDHVTHVGSLNPSQRADFLAAADVFICPTVYIGPFETVHAEALMSGVPVVAPDYGVFTETVDPEFRYRTLQGAVEATQRALGYVENDPGFKTALRASAIKRFSIEACSKMYDEWFTRLEGLKGLGWYG